MNPLAPARNAIVGALPADAVARTAQTLLQGEWLGKRIKDDLVGDKPCDRRPDARDRDGIVRAAHRAILERPIRCR